MSRNARSTRTTRTASTTAHRFAVVTIAALALVALVGCAVPAEKPAAETPKTVATTFPVTITDDASRTVTIKAEPQRIVSLAPANTEIAFALGLGEKVVGVTTYDDYPAEVTKIAKIGDFTTPNIEAIAAAKPDLILATTGVQADVLAKLEDLGATVIALDPQNLAGVYTAIERTGKATGAVAKASALVDAMKVDVDKVAASVEGTEPVTAFVEIAQNPLYTAGTGTLLDELITLGGGTNVVTQPSWVAYSAEQVVKDDPTVYMATKGSMSDPAQLSQRAGFSELSAVKSGRVVILDDNLVSRPGPRVVEGLKAIAAALHPELASK